MPKPQRSTRAPSAEGVTETDRRRPEAMQRRTDVDIDPPDADGDDANGHQVALEGVEEITVTVTSADGSRERRPTAWPSREPVAEIALAGRLEHVHLARRRRRLHRRRPARRRESRQRHLRRGRRPLRLERGRLAAWLAFLPALGERARRQHARHPGAGRHAYWIAVSGARDLDRRRLDHGRGGRGRGHGAADRLRGNRDRPGRLRRPAGLAMEAYVGDTRCNAGEPVATYRALEDGVARSRGTTPASRTWTSLPAAPPPEADVTFRIDGHAVVETGTWDNSAYPWQALGLTLARETVTEETVTIDVAVWRRNEDPFNALADLYISTRAPGESWNTHDDDGPLVMTLYTSPRTGARNWYRSDSHARGGRPWGRLNGHHRRRRLAERRRPDEALHQHARARRRLDHPRRRRTARHDPPHEPPLWRPELVPERSHTHRGRPHPGSGKIGRTGGRRALGGCWPPTCNALGLPRRLHAWRDGLRPGVRGGAHPGASPLRREALPERAGAR